MKRLKSEKGSVTVLVIVTLVFFMIVLTTAYLAASNTRVSQLKETQRIKEIYEKDVENIESIYSSLLGEKFSDIYQSNTKYVDRDGKSVTIPKDFAVGVGSKINTVKNGLVITDAVDINGNSIGNEFVWVPVENPVYNEIIEMTTEEFNQKYTSPAKLNTVINSLKTTITTDGITPMAIKIKITDQPDVTKQYQYVSILYDFSETGVVPKTYSTAYREPDVLGNGSTDENTTYMSNFKDSSGRVATSREDVRDILQEEYTTMMKNIEREKGFWIGRYETSGTEKRVESKKEIIPATNSWYGLYTMQRDFAQGKASIQSSMIAGSQWDAVLNWMYKDENAAIKTYVYDSTVCGWFPDNYSENASHLTGKEIVENGVIKNAPKNIYDMAGNWFEWTLEASYDVNRVYRGGNYINLSPVSKRVYNVPVGGNDYTSRLVLTTMPEIVKQDGSFDTAKGVNSPKITGTGLKPVYFNGEEKVYLTEASSQEEWDKWYSYSENNPVWANAESSDGSLWVWIPRYAYKITSNLGTGTKGNIDVVFVDIKNKNNGTTYSATYPTVSNNAMEDYVVHPAFINDSANGYVNGGWKEDIPGIWVAKYAAGFQNSTVGEDTKQVQYSNLPYTELNGFTSNFLETTLTKNTTKMSYPVFKSNTYAYNIISVGDAFLLAKEIGKASDMYGLSNVDSHLMKNSEWGAVAYLAQSKYGRNGNEITINSKNLNNSIYVNNASSGTKAYVYAVTGYGNKNTANDVSASTTNNMSGIFDLSGCVWERVAGYKKGGAASTPTWHNSMASSSTSESSEYLTLYESYGDHYGDAVKETSGSSSSGVSWNSDYSRFVSSSVPVFGRGGSCGAGGYAGSFAFRDSYGYPMRGDGFRAVLVP